jgi:hypothetical protein
MLSRLTPLARRTATSVASSTKSSATGGGTALGNARADAARRGPADMPGPLGSRRVSVLANPTKTEGGKVIDPGHIQFQYSESEADRVALLTGSEAAAAIGHSRDTELPGKRNLQPVTIGGETFQVRGMKGPAIDSGADKPLMETKDTLHADLGELSDAQLHALHSISEGKVYDQYETSGNEGSNCVHAAADISNKVFGTELKMPPNATPQEAFRAIVGAVKERSDRSETV